MTKKEAIKVLRTESIELGRSSVSVCRFWKALDMAVKAFDAVPVVRCSECKSYNKPRTGWCEVHLDTEPSNGYCYWGKPKDGDGNEP